MATSSQARNTGSKRTLWFILLLLALVVATLVYLTQTNLENARQAQLEELETSFTFQAQDRASQLGLWFSRLSDQISQTSGGDSLRLFASEAGSGTYDAATILARSFQGASQSVFAPTGTSDAANLAQFTRQSQNARNELINLAERADLQSVRLFNRQNQLVLSNLASDLEFQPRPGLAAQLDKTASQGQIIALPVYLDNGKLSLDLAVPLLAPAYADPSGEQIVGVLLVSLDISAVVQEHTSAANLSQQLPAHLLLQYDAGNLQIISPTQGLIDLEGWKLNSKGDLPLAERALPATAPGGPDLAYSLSLPVSNLNWLVAYTLPVQAVEADFAQQRQNILVTAALIGLVLTLLLFMLWWRVLGKRERSVNAQIKELYQTVNEQKQIMDGVNSSLSEGIVYNTLDGQIAYANNSFMMMAEENADSIGTRTLRTLNSRVLAANIQAHTDSVFKLNMPSSFLETLSVLGYYRHFQISCSPFRDQQGAMTGMVSLYRDITELVLAQERAQSMVGKTVSVFVRAIEAVDPYLRGHAAWTGRLAVILAEHLGQADHAFTLQTAANLSQIGMIQLPRDLITKNEKLTPEERAQLETHIIYAQQALEGIDFGYPILEAITQMNERLDGSGYPDGLRGEQIGLDGRILAVANTFCAMMRPRSYRRARAENDIVQLLLTDPPTYDPQVVRTLAAFLNSEAGRVFVAGLRESA